MSILNHFGKVNYVPYKSKYQDSKMYPQTHEGYIRTKEMVQVFGLAGFTTTKNTSGCYYPYTYFTDHAKTQKTTILFDTVNDNKLFSELIHFEKRPCAIVTQSAGPRQYIVQDFPEVVKKITNSYTTPILSTLNIPQMFTLSELIWLKVDDVDSRVDHLEKMLAQVIDDNKLLQEKVNALEQKHIRESRRVLIEELD